MAVWPLDSLIPLEEEEKPSNIPGGICWFSSSPCRAGGSIHTGSVNAVQTEETQPPKKTSTQYTQSQAAHAGSMDEDPVQREREARRSLYFAVARTALLHLP